MEEQLPEPCYRCYFCHIISALHILAHMLEGDRGVSKLVSISKIKLKKKKISISTSSTCSFLSFLSGEFVLVGVMLDFR